MRNFFRVRPAIRTAFIAMGFLFGLLYVAVGAFLLIYASINALDAPFIAEGQMFLFPGLFWTGMWTGNLLIHSDDTTTSCTVVSDPNKSE